LLSTQAKEGRTGRLTLVTVGHTIFQNGEIVVEERQDIVYRDAATETEPATSSSSADSTNAGEADVEPGEWRVPVSPTLLFRFSALTYNAHRIYYDCDYARDVEGYPGLVTHGPLQALVMGETRVHAASPPNQDLAEHEPAPHRAPDVWPGGRSRSQKMGSSYRRSKSSWVPRVHPCPRCTGTTATASTPPTR